MSKKCRRNSNEKLLDIKSAMSYAKKKYVLNIIYYIPALKKKEFNTELLDIQVIT